MTERDRTPQQADAPEPDELDEGGFAEVTNPRAEDPATADEHERLLPPGYRPGRSSAFGVTAAEQREGRPLRQRLLEEEADAGAQDDPSSDLDAPDRPAGRIAGPDDATSDADLDEEPELIGDETVDDSSPSAEEEAVHTVDEPVDERAGGRARPA